MKASEFQSAIGFYIDASQDSQVTRRGIAACDRALSHFPWLNRKRVKYGNADLYIWGHGKLHRSIQIDELGNLYVLIGSPVPNDVTLKDVANSLTEQDYAAFRLPWEGRCVLLRVSASGQNWTMRNDWIGSIPVFYAPSENGNRYVASTIEPAVVDAVGLGPNDFFFPGLVSLLMNGHYLDDWTLFAKMKTVPPDSFARWDDNGFQRNHLWTVQPSSERWHYGWDNLVDEMYWLSRKIITEVLETGNSWILPLSGGIDSRLIAAVGAERGIPFHAYTYGPEDWIETIYAKKVAKELEISWQRVPIEPDYLNKYTRLWFEWFGSALHCHGMYQMPFLTELKNEPDGRILQGYMGDPLAGNHLQALISAWKTAENIMPVVSPFCTPEILFDLLAFDSWMDAVNMVAKKTQAEIDGIQGSHFQQLMFLDFWNRQRLFIYYQPTMYDYFRGVDTPFLNRDYSRFCLSLPHCALHNRRLQKDMLRKYYPKMASIGGTFAGPLTQSERHYLKHAHHLKRAIAQKLSNWLPVFIMPEYAFKNNKIQTDALHEFGESALWPLNETRKNLVSLFNMNILEEIYQQAAAGNEKAYNQLRPIQSVAWHFVK